MIGSDQVSPHAQDAWQPACRGVEPEVFFGPADSPASRPLHGWGQQYRADDDEGPFRWLSHCREHAPVYSRTSRITVRLIPCPPGIDFPRDGPTGRGPLVVLDFDGVQRHHRRLACHSGMVDRALDVAGSSLVSPTPYRQA
jgi:hypothetical protein